MRPNPDVARQKKANTAGGGGGGRGMSGGSARGVPLVGERGRSGVGLAGCTKGDQSNSHIMEVEVARGRRERTGRVLRRAVSNSTKSLYRLCACMEVP